MNHSHVPHCFRNDGKCSCKKGTFAKTSASMRPVSTSCQMSIVIAATCAPSQPTTAHIVLASIAIACCIVGLSVACTTTRQANSAANMK